MIIDLRNTIIDINDVYVQYILKSLNSSVWIKMWFELDYFRISLILVAQFVNNSNYDFASI